MNRLQHADNTPLTSPFSWSLVKQDTRKAYDTNAGNACTNRRRRERSKTASL